MSNAEILHERKMRDVAIINQGVKKGDAIQKERAHTVFPYNGLVSQMLSKAVKILEGRLKPAGKGRPEIGVTPLRMQPLPLDVVCAIAAVTIVDGVVAGQRIQKISRSIGSRVEDQIRMKELKRREPLLHRNMRMQMKERGSQDYGAQAKFLKGALLKAESEEQWKPWSVQDRAKLGLLIIDALFAAGFVQKGYVPGKAKNQQNMRLEFTERVAEALTANDERAAEILRPWMKPMVTPPVPWTSPTDGGYEELDVQLVKVRRRNDIERFRSTEMPAVYQSVNAIQRTPWKVNEDVLVVWEELTRMGVSLKGVPNSTSDECPARPTDIPLKKDEPEAGLNEAQLKSLKGWIKAKAEWHNATAKRKSKNMQAHQIASVAREMKDHPAIYFPHQLDYRGRVYPLPLQLNPQGNDLSKSLLTFAEGHPLGDMGGFWLAVHGAGVWGEDKGSLEDRVDWILELSEEIVACAEDPLTFDWWQGADGGNKPFQFLAFCFEWAGYVGSGESPDYVSHLPVAVDGACNGIQHFSAMLRDAGGAQATNLCAGLPRQDVYQEVADAVNERVEAAIDGRSAVKRELAGVWKRFGVDRKVVKRPVMTTPYGATAIGMKGMLLEDTINQHPDFNWGEKSWDAATWMAEAIDQSIAEKLSAAREAMAFLQELAAETARHDLSMTWTNPAGFPVLQRALNQRRFVVDTGLLGRVKLLYQDTSEDLDKKKQKSGIAPNFVHSYDAAHLMLTVCAMEGELNESVSWAMVHDSFGTHAGRVQKLNEVLREQFVLMYSTREPLADLRDEMVQKLPEGVDVPETPEEGTFNLHEVLEAEFFFA